MKPIARLENDSTKIGSMILLAATRHAGKLFLVRPDQKEAVRIERGSTRINKRRFAVQKYNNKKAPAVLGRQG
jgi:hypothetical protein